MQQFVNHIIDFVRDILNSVYNYFQQLSASSLNNYLIWTNKNVFSDNSIIGINLTWNELLLYFLTYFLIILLIVLFVRFIFKILGLFRFNRLND